MSTSLKDYAFRQVDVFSDRVLKGNPLAVVLEAEGISDQVMADFSNWNNLSETTYLLPPRDPSADYHLRIFTPRGELPFAGHPTLGSAQVWLDAGGRPKGTDIVQECGAGLVRTRRMDGRLAFAAPPLRRHGPADEATRARALAGLGLQEAEVAAVEWVDNGPAWLLVMMQERGRLLSVTADFTILDGLKIGLCAAWTTPDRAADFEVRALVAQGVEDPVTGSLNAGIAQWMIATGRAPGSYVARQGTVLGREGQVFVTSEGGDIWIGGAVTGCITGTLRL